MTYLQRALTGNAKRAVGGMLNHGHLYKAALTELEEQFGNEELVAGAFMKTVLNHPIVVEGGIAQLRSFYNTLHNAVATMKSLGYSHDLTSSTNTRAVLQKLPDPLKEKWVRTVWCATASMQLRSVRNSWQWMSTKECN